MKRSLFLICALFSIFLATAQSTVRTHQDLPAYTAEAFSAEVRPFGNERSPMAPLFANDVIIDNASNIDQRRVRISVAFNGWIYAAYYAAGPSAGYGAITIKMSRDNGLTWTMFSNFSFPNSQYNAFDIVVTGTDTNNLKLYNAGVLHDSVANYYSLFIDSYNARTGANTGQVYGMAHGTLPINDIAIVSDYRFPALGSSPYGIGVAYSAFGTNSDSIIFLASPDAGLTWPTRQTVQTTGFYSRGLSLSYGRSASWSNGRYFIAWEELNSQTDRNASKIYSCRNQSTFNGAWTVPVQIDLLGPSLAGICRHPSIATSFTNTDNDSGGVTAVVLVERDFNNDGLDYDILGLYNKKATSTDFWTRLDVHNSPINDLQPDVSYDPTNNNFLTTYYDSTNGVLPYQINNFNLVSPSTWTTISTQYNDVTTNLKAAWPRVEINPAQTQTVHAWIAEGSGGRGVAMFDAEFNGTGIETETGAIGVAQVYPNPANETSTLSFVLRQGATVTITLYNAIGQAVSTTTAEYGAGKNTESINVQDLPAGMYLIQLQTGQQTTTKQLIVNH